MLLVVDRAEKSGQSPASVHYRRMAWLAIFGLCHFFFIWWGDILFLYAAVGCIAFLFRNWEPRRLIRWAVGLFTLGILLMTLLFGGQLFAASSIDDPAAPPSLGRRPSRASRRADPRGPRPHPRGPPSRPAPSNRQGGARAPARPPRSRPARLPASRGRHPDAPHAAASPAAAASLAFNSPTSRRCSSENDASALPGEVTTLSIAAAASLPSCDRGFELMLINSRVRIPLPPLPVQAGPHSGEKRELIANNSCYVRAT